MDEKNQQVFSIAFSLLINKYLCFDQEYLLVFIIYFKLRDMIHLYQRKLSTRWGKSIVHTFEKTLAEIIQPIMWLLVYLLTLSISLICSWTLSRLS